MLAALAELSEVTIKKKQYAESGDLESGLGWMEWVASNADKTRQDKIRHGMTITLTLTLTLTLNLNLN